ncbi:ABC transporter ATP-binding protein [Candidatus Bathyarchaeota archaeon]|nr:MAG: ABC transporter ATP-binding protein [Candidatus Bathyarchaeota archaeon]
MPEVRLVNVTKRYGRILANDHVNLTIRDGEYISVIGPSGCGKSTLIKSIAGIIEPDEGEIYIDGKIVNNIPIEDRGIGYVFQNIALFPHMNVWENITYGPDVKGFLPEETKTIAREMIEMIKVSARIDAYPDELSGGTQQKIAVARALMSRSSLMLLDEPLGALDLKVRSVLRYELRRIAKALGITVLHVTHDQEEAMSISDRIVVMRKGRIVESGKPLQLYMKPKNLFTANFVGEANFLVGKIEKVSEKGLLIDIGNGLKVFSTESKGNIGDRVVVAFRPEFVILKEKNDENAFFGEITRIVYSGSLVRITVETASGDEILIKNPLKFGEPPPETGEKLTFSIPPENVLVYPYPEAGLHKELSLE